MAFEREFISGNVGAGSYAPKFFSYKTATDSKATVAGADYFLTGYDVLDADDAILAVCSDGMIVLRVLVSNSTTVTTELLETTTV